MLIHLFALGSLRSTVASQFDRDNMMEFNMMESVQGDGRGNNLTIESGAVNQNLDDGNSGADQDAGAGNDDDAAR
jgi:hypothetical protein